jgi:hypothetical protein
VGKLECRGHLNAVAPGTLLFVRGKFTNRRFLVDTGASFLVFPFRSDLKPCGPRLSGPDGLEIPCWGPRRVCLNFGRRWFSWPFLLAAVKFPIIGMDFLKFFRLLVDPAGGQLLGARDGVDGPAAIGGKTAVLAVAATGSNSVQDSTCGTPVSSFYPPPTTTPSSSPGQGAAAATTSGSGNKQLLQLLSVRYAAVFNPSKVLPPVTHSVEHHLVTRGLPISSKFRRLDGVKLAAAKAEFEKMEQDGMVCRSTSPWASPLHMVEKSDGGLRPW